MAKNLKTIYLAPNEQQGQDNLQRVKEKWTQPLSGWGKVYGEFAIMYEGRIPL